jgi:chemotaxis methyl-accepting protein methylase
VRIWVCGCSTGEEAYSLAILFLEAFEERGEAPGIKILATDLHQESLLQAARGRIPGEQLSPTCRPSCAKSTSRSSRAASSRSRPTCARR